MQATGVKPLKESQIISWWSTYHQKRKRLLTAKADYLRGLHARHLPLALPFLFRKPLATLSFLFSKLLPKPLALLFLISKPLLLKPPALMFLLSTPLLLRHLALLFLISKPGSTVSVHPSSFLTGNVVAGHSDLLQWTFSANFSQSIPRGRSGSNAFAFIACTLATYTIIEN